MKALVYNGANQRAVEERPRPTLESGKDAIVKMVKSAICGTDLHILKGDTPEVPLGTILGHEGIGIVEEVGPDVTRFKVGDKVILSCVTACGTCEYCKQGMHSHCEDGGWILGHLIDGVQAEYVRIPHADTSMYHIPEGISDDAAVLLSDMLPTGYEVGVLNGQVGVGDTVAIVGLGPVGLSTLLTAQFYSPANIIAIDLDDNRLELAKQLGATHTVNSGNLEEAYAKINEITGGAGVDVAIEAVGVPQTFDICQKIVAKGGNVANVGVHGKPVQLDLQDLWIRNVTITTGLVDTRTTPTLIKAVASGQIHPEPLITHHCDFEDVMEAYEIFGNAAESKAIKVVLVY